MRIYTLNVNGFRGADKQPGDYVPANELRENLQNFIAAIDKIVEDEQSILIVQEFPHMSGDCSSYPFRWSVNPFYNECVEVIESIYKLIQPAHLINSEQCTVAICKEGSPWDRSDIERVHYDSRYSYGNALLELHYDDITLLGVHVKPNIQMWDMIFNAIKNHGKYTFIAGDFNAYELRGGMKDKPKQLRSLRYRSFVPNSIITDIKHNSSIDNIYMDEDYHFGEMLIPDIRPLDVFQTDHILCGIEFVIEDDEV